MNAVELLKKQHREVDALVERFEESKRMSEKEAIFLEIAARLVAHDAIEREIFYPACERAVGKIEPLMEGIAEHGLMEFSIFRADRARGKDSFEYLVKVLAEIVEHHVEEEEHEVLPKAAEEMSEGRLNELGERMRERFEASMGRDFRLALRRNLEQVLSGRTKTTPAKKRTTGATERKRAATARKRPATGRKRTARTSKRASKRASSRR